MSDAWKIVGEWKIKMWKAKHHLREAMRDVTDNEQRKLVSSINCDVYSIKHFLHEMGLLRDSCIETLELVSNESIVDTLIKSECPLYKLVILDRTDLLKIMLEQGAREVNELEGQKPTFHRVVCKTLEMVQLFLQYNVDVNIKDEEGNSALHIIHGSDKCLKVAKFLISAKANVNSINNDGHTPLYSAIFDAKSLKLIWFFLENGGLLKPDKKCAHALHTSDQRSLSDAFDHLMYCELDLDSTDVKGNTILHNAMECCNMEFVKLLVEKGANVLQVNQSGYTPLQLILNEQGLSHRLNNKAAIDVMEICFDFDLDPNRENEEDQTVLRLTFDLMSNRYFEFNVNLMGPVLKAIAKLEVKKSFINEKDSSLIQSIDSLKLNYEKYKTECVELKAFNIRENITLFDILTDNFRDVLVYANNIDLVELYQKYNLKEKFPFYSSNIMNRYSEAKLMNKLTNESSIVLSKILKSLPMSVIKCEIVCYLSKSDMLKLTYKVNKN